MPAPKPFSPDGAICIVTGGANGIGLALARELKARGAAHVVLADQDEDALERAAEEIGGLTFAIDAADFEEIDSMVDEVEDKVGPVSLFCANAGILGAADPLPVNPASADLDDFRRAFEVNCLAHIMAAKACLPRFLERGEGWFLNTVSAAGLLSQIGAAPYSVSKHAAIGWAESLAYSVRDSGIGVSVLCPQAVRTQMIGPDPEAGLKGGADIDGIAEPADVACLALDQMAAGDFLVTPHPSVRQYMRNKADNYERWIGGMAKLRRGVL